MKLSLSKALNIIHATPSLFEKLLLCLEYKNFHIIFKYFNKELSILRIEPGVEKSVGLDEF